MAVAFVASDQVSGSGSPSLVIDGTGSDRFVWQQVSGTSGGVRTITNLTLNSVTASGLATTSADGGIAIMSGRGYLLDASEPGAGTFTATDTWTGGATPANRLYSSIELSGVDQTTPISSTTTNTGTAVANGGTVSVTVTGESGKFAIAFISSSNGGVSGNHILPTGFTEVEDTNNGSNRTAIGYIGSIASGSETYNFTADGDGTNGMNSVVVGVIVLNAAAGGVTVSPANGTASITGQAVTVVTNALVSPSSGTISIAGQAMSLPIGRVINVPVGTISIAGQTATLFTATAINPTTGTLSIAGYSTSLVMARDISVDTATITINGQTVTVSAVFVVTEEGVLIFPLISELIYELIRD
jgi:hypothetical protein